MTEGDKSDLGIADKYYTIVHIKERGQEGRGEK